MVAVHHGRDWRRDAHGVGSAATYAKRYALSAALATAPVEDDDGNAAVQSPKAESRADAKKAPEGFDNWLADMEATADEGVAALEKAWKASQPYMRQYLTETNKARWESVKARAQKAQVAA